MPREWHYYRHDAANTLQAEASPYYGPGLHPGQNNNVAHSLIYAAAMLTGRGGPVTRVAVVAAGAVANTAKAALYARISPANQYPATLLLDCGCYDLTASTIVANSVSITLAADTIVWCCVMVNSNGSALRGVEGTETPGVLGSAATLDEARGIFTVPHSYGGGWPATFPVPTAAPSFPTAMGTCFVQFSGG